jgi:hypothetical protein
VEQVQAAELPLIQQIKPVRNLAVVQVLVRLQLRQEQWSEVHHYAAVVVVEWAVHTRQFPQILPEILAGNQGVTRLAAAVLTEQILQLVQRLRVRLAVTETPVEADMAAVAAVQQLLLQRLVVTAVLVVSAAAAVVVVALE